MSESGIDDTPQTGSLAPSKGGLAGATIGMGIGTALSRLTGIGRIVALTYVLGTLGTADAYNLANTTPNIMHDIVIGGVLAATFVPVFSDRLATRSGREAWRAISAVTTITIAVLAVATVLFWLLTPAIIHLYTSANHSPERAQQQAVAIELLRWFVPQLACYGLIGLFTALLNARHKFAVPMFVAIANNVVVVAVLIWFHALVPHPTLAAVDHQRHALVLLGLGTTMGVVAQAALLLPSLRRANLHLRFRWEPAHEAVRTIVHLAGWTFAFVITSQAALVVILTLADGVRPQGAVSAYTYAFTFFQLPYGVVAVSVMSAVTPSLSARWAVGDRAGFRSRLAFGMRGILAIIIPSSVGMLILARPLIDLILVHGSTTLADGSGTAAALAMFTLGLPGFSLFLYLVRVFQSMQDTRTVFFLYLVENGVNVAFGLLLVGPLGVRGLALSMSIAYTVAALLALRIVRDRAGGLGGDQITRPLKRVALSSVVMAVATVLAVDVSSADHGTALLVRVGFAILVGSVAYVGTATALGARDRRHRRDRTTGVRWPRDPEGPNGPPRMGPPAGTPVPSTASPSPPPFRGRLGTGPTGPSVRLLRPVRDPPGDEEEIHGPGPGGH
jgi:putative peptidoglycan lipid II flippase